MREKAMSAPSTEDILQTARDLPAEKLPEFIGHLETAKVIAWARATAPTLQAPHDELLGVAEAAHRLGVSEGYLYTHHGEYPFTRRQGRKLLFSAEGIERYIRQNRP